jgi:hypothetical protein
VPQPIRGKVAQVLGNRELVMNVGIADGVTVGMYFSLVKITEIKDPDTSKVLGKVERPKISLQVIEVQDELSVASAVGSRRILEKTGPFTSSLLDSNTVSIAVGDVVVQLIGS